MLKIKEQGVISGLKMTFRYTAHGRLFGLKVTGPKVRKPNYRPWAVFRKDPVHNKTRTKQELESAVDFSKMPNIIKRIT